VQEALASKLTYRQLIIATAHGRNAPLYRRMTGRDAWPRDRRVSPADAG
jgi:hypothetical protein